MNQPISFIFGNSDRGLLKILGTGFGVAVGVGAVIGSGILRAPSAIAGEVPGNWLILGLWVLGAIQALLSANIYAELGTAMPRCGADYVFAQRVYGDVGGLVVGWSVWLAFIASIAAASVSFAEFLPLIIPSAAQHRTAVVVTLLLAIYGANILGLRPGRAIQISTSTVKAAMLFLFVLAALLVASPAETRQHSTSDPIWSAGGIILAYKLVFGTYAGWQTPLCFSGESKAPARSIPRSLFLGILLTAILFIGINAALLDAMGPHEVARSPLPFSVVIGRLGGPIASFLFALTAMVTVVSCANANVMGNARVLFALAEDGLLPVALRAVNAGGSPVVAYVLAAVISIALATSGQFILVFGLIATLNMFGAVLVEASFFILRWREPHLERPYKALGYPWLPVLALIVDSTLLCFVIYADRVGDIVAIGLLLLCVPLAMMARRARRAPILASVRSSAT